MYIYIYIYKLYINYKLSKRHNIYNYIYIINIVHSHLNPKESKSEMIDTVSVGLLVYIEMKS